MAKAAPALIELVNVYRTFPAGDQTIAVLQDINLHIRAGEMVAIVGASGSGKSTLMNILGCLDRPSAGSYRVAGRATASLDADALAQLRREHFGFIFQRYHLLTDLHARGNVEVPAVYAGSPRAERHRRADRLLSDLGLADRIGYLPNQLSGGQQQRVSIARALMNGGQVILADEPTGALDTASGRQVIGILERLHAQGHTIILVTHDMQVAAHAERIIEISDGRITADRPNPDPVRELTEEPQAVSGTHPVVAHHPHPLRAFLDRFLEAFRMALLAMNAHRLRTFLTMLGIIIGIASVVSVVALGEGSRQRILKDISSIGTNTIEVFSGSGFGDIHAGRVQTLRPADARAFADQPYVDSVTPTVSTTVVARYRNTSANAMVKGVGAGYFRVKGIEVAQGQLFGQDSVERIAQEVVIDHNTLKTFFTSQNRREVLGQVILLDNMPCRIIGVTKEKDSAFNNSENLQVFVPYTTAMSRLLGQTYLDSLTIRISDAVSSDQAERGIIKLLTVRHGTKDFYTMNTDSIRQTIESTTKTMTLLIASIAVISLVVGGIGVMNIMLVSVTERTREIGVRMAVGARQSDIMQQFLIEAVLVCLLGGLLGILLALGIGVAFAHSSAGFTMAFSVQSMIAAFTCSSLIGAIFGFLPARNAARLDPIEALARE